MEQFPDKAALEAARARITPYIHRTPVLRCSALNTMTGADLYFKCENFQKIGAFKIRGATNLMRSLPAAQLANGVVTHSSGNHAQAVAYVARDLGVPAYIVMPATAPAVKVAAVEGYGAEITLCEPTLQARQSTAQAIVDRTGATFVHPFDDYRIIAGQSSAAQELLEEVPGLDIVMAPVGGGGLLCGTALAVHHWAPQVQVVAAEPDGADDAFRSFRDGKRYPSEQPDTIADGLLTGIGKRNFPIMLQYVHQVVTASDEAIVQAMRHTWERMKIIIEPSCAVPLATLLEKKVDVNGKKVGIILTGGNVDLGKLPF